ncbi:hypothetical protein M514_09369, partial [Trichuris suis]
MESSKHPIHTIVFRSLKRTHEMFRCLQGTCPRLEEQDLALRKAVKIKSEYGHCVAKAKERKKMEEYKSMPLPLPEKQPSLPESQRNINGQLMLTGSPVSMSVAKVPEEQPRVQAAVSRADSYSSVSLLPHKAAVAVKPMWHPPWKLYRVISGHTGWIRCIDVEPGNQWFCTGAADRIIKIWDLASGKLKLSLTGHVSTVRAVKVSPRQPYLFSAGEDKQVKCWDLEYNKVIRHYHGHLSAVYDLAVHPTIDVIVTTSRDSTARVWDMRTKAQVHCLTGHTNTVATVTCQSADPQIITGSHDCTIRLWDLANGTSLVTLTNHKKSIRAVALHPKLFMFASASPDNIKQWKFPNGEFVQNLSGHNAIVNALAINQDNVLVSGGDNGSIHFWDWKSGLAFQKYQTKPQPGSIDSEAGVFALTFDQSGSRLISGEADKTIKMFKEDETATEETHPILWRPEILKRRQFY